ncbi:MAG: hypothetical protein MUO26_15270 [Methanotrichaceae archaeon]|nr:hypothetical protein [Methanotrichaceae archaeon]
MVRYIVNIYAASLERLRDLQRIYDLDIFRGTARQIDSNFTVEALVSAEEIARLRNEGYGVEILKNAEELMRKHRNEAK